MAEKIFLGTLKHDGKFGDKSGAWGENSTRNRVYLEKHKWDCGWYWGFGYIGNRAWHTHFDSLFLNGADTSVDKLFIKSKFTQTEWWELRDMFIQAYALK